MPILTQDHIGGTDIPLALFAGPLDPQVAQQPVERLLVGVVLFQRVGTSPREGRPSAAFIPTLRSGDGLGQPGGAGERGQSAGLGEQRVPGGAGSITNGLVAAGEEAVADTGPMKW
jgi:hypothetical protein